MGLLILSSAIAADVTVGLTGVSASTTVGNLTRSTACPISTVLATGAVGTVSTAGDIIVGISGVTATGAVSATGVALSRAITSTQGTATVGLVGGIRTITITGLSVSGLVGDVGIGEQTIVAISGVSATASVGTVAYTKDGTLVLTGVVSAGLTGTVTPTGGAPLQWAPSVRRAHTVRGLVAMTPRRARHRVRVA